MLVLVNSVVLDCSLVYGLMFGFGGDLFVVLVLCWFLGVCGCCVLDVGWLIGLVGCGDWYFCLGGVVCAKSSRFSVCGWCFNCVGWVAVR